MRILFVFLTCNRLTHTHTHTHTDTNRSTSKIMKTKTILITRLPSEERFFLLAGFQQTNKESLQDKYKEGFQMYLENGGIS